MDADDQSTECALRCRQLASRTYELADEAEHPYVIGQYLRIAGKLTACANKAQRGETYAWPDAED